VRRIGKIGKKKRKKADKLKGKLPADLADVLRREEREDDATANRPTWRDEAIAVGWPENELQMLDEIIENAAKHHSDERVVAVSRRTIHLYSVAEIRFDEAKVVTKRSRWRWRLHVRAGVQEAPHERSEPWCPGHGTTCVPTQYGQCGAVGIISFEVCGCVGRFHDPKCEVFARSKEDELREKLKPAQKILAFNDKITAARTLTHALPDHAKQPGPPPAEKAKKATKSNNWFLPGQLSLPIQPRKR